MQKTFQVLALTSIAFHGLFLKTHKSNWKINACSTWVNGMGKIYSDIYYRVKLQSDINII